MTPPYPTLPKGDGKVETIIIMLLEKNKGKK